MPALTILYTANLQAGFDLMARVFTTIQQARRNFAHAEGPMMLLDIGGAWSRDAWVCRATANRAPYLLLDAMGYTAVYADGLEMETIIELQATVQVRLLANDMSYHWRWRDIDLNIGLSGDTPCITWATEARPETNFYRSQPGNLVLLPLYNEVGILHINWPELEVLIAQRIPYDRQARPDPSITAAAEFIEREARYYAERNKG